MTFKHAEQAKTQEVLRKLTAYRNMAYTMQECLKAIASGDANAQKLATETLAQLNKEYGNGFERS